MKAPVVPHNRRMIDTNALHPYAELTPDRVMDALQELGLWPDGRLLALSSYENRVYRAHLDEPVQGASMATLIGTVATKRCICSPCVAAPKMTMLT